MACKSCYKTCFFSWKICRLKFTPYLCTVFFIVLDLRLIKVGVQRYSFFYARIFGFLKLKIKRGHVLLKTTVRFFNRIITRNFYI